MRVESLVLLLVIIRALILANSVHIIVLALVLIWILIVILIQILILILLYTCLNCHVLNLGLSIRILVPHFALVLCCLCKDARLLLLRRLNKHLCILVCILSLEVLHANLVLLSCCCLHLCSICILSALYCL